MAYRLLVPVTGRKEILYRAWAPGSDTRQFVLLLVSFTRYAEIVYASAKELTSGNCVCLTLCFTVCVYAIPIPYSLFLFPIPYSYSLCSTQDTLAAMILVVVMM